MRRESRSPVRPQQVLAATRSLRRETLRPVDAYAPSNPELPARDRWAKVRQPTPGRASRAPLRRSDLTALPIARIICRRSPMPGTRVVTIKRPDDAKSRSASFRCRAKDPSGSATPSTHAPGWPSMPSRSVVHRTLPRFLRIRRNAEGSVRRLNVSKVCGG
jgi:hypothetical protein